jgi:sulfate transport system permease protein
MSATTTAAVAGGRRQHQRPARDTGATPAVRSGDASRDGPTAQRERASPPARRERSGPLARAVGRRHSVLPGFDLALGITLLYLGVIVLIPLSAAFLKTFTMSWPAFQEAVASPRVLAAYRLTFGASLAAALVNAGFGLVVTWVLVRYRFPGRRVVDALIDLPFALPTAVAGIALTALYAENGWIGRGLAVLGIKVAYTPLGVFVALTFIGLPFVVRTLQPVLEDLQRDVEEVAATLGASRLQTFTRVILPVLAPALLTGFALAFARALGEYGSVIFIAGNMPMVSEIAPLLIVAKLEQYDYTGATAIAVVLLVAAFALLLAINGLQAWARKRQGH